MLQLKEKNKKADKMYTIHQDFTILYLIEKKDPVPAELISYPDPDLAEIITDPDPDLAEIIKDLDPDPAEIITDPDLLT